METPWLTATPQSMLPGVPQRTKVAGEVQAREIMTGLVQTLEASQRVSEALMTLLVHGIHGAPVVDGAGKAVGMFSFTDIIRFQHNRARRRPTDDPRVAVTPTIGRRMKDIPWRAVGKVLVKDLMQRGLIAVDEDACLADIMHVMLDHHIHRVVVRRAGTGDVCGIIAYSDVMRALLRTVMT